jgi:CheY-like chemotaxis protein
MGLITPTPGKVATPYGEQMQKESANSETRDRCPEPMLVLHVNDNTDDQVLLQAAAKEAGVPIHWHIADSVESGISYLESLLSANAKHTVRWIDLILLDLVYHEDEGLRVLKFIRGTPELKRIPVVVYTGALDPNTLDAARELGANDLQAKPTTFKQTVALTRRLYEDWGSRPAHV